MKAKIIALSAAMLLMSGCQTTSSNNTADKQEIVENSTTLFLDQGLTKYQEDKNVISYYKVVNGKFYFYFYTKRYNTTLQCTMAYYGVYANNDAATERTFKDASLPDSEVNVKELTYPEVLSLIRNRPRQVMVNNVSVSTYEGEVEKKADKVYIIDFDDLPISGATFFLPRKTATRTPGIQIEFDVRSGKNSSGYDCNPYNSDKLFPKDKYNRIDSSRYEQYIDGTRYTYYFNKDKFDKVCSYMKDGVYVLTDQKVNAGSWSPGILLNKGWVDRMMCSDANRVNYR